MLFWPVDTAEEINAKFFGGDVLRIRYHEMGKPTQDNTCLTWVYGVNSEQVMRPDQYDRIPI